MSNEDINHTKEQREAVWEAYVAAVFAHPDIFPPGTTLEQYEEKMAYLKQIRDVMGLPLNKG